MSYVYSDGETTVAVDYDAFPESPREWDNLGTMLTWGRDFNSPDENPYSEPQDFIYEMFDEYLSDKDIINFTKESEVLADLVNSKLSEFEQKEILLGSANISPEFRETILLELAELKDAPKYLENKMFLFPLYRFNHSNIAYSIESFNDPWDSGQVGFVYVDEQKARMELGQNYEFENVYDQVKRICSSEVDDYSKWANGDVYVARTFEYEKAIHDWEETQCIHGYYYIEDAVNDSALNFDSVSANVFNEPDSFSSSDIGSFIEENFPEKYKELTYISPEEQLAALKEQRAKLDEEIGSLEAEARDMSAAKDVQDTPATGHDKNKGAK